MTQLEFGGLERGVSLIMSTTQTLERNDHTGLSDSAHSSTSSADRYRLDQEDDRPILLYKYRGQLQTSSQKDLCAWLDKGKLALSPPNRIMYHTDIEAFTDEKLRCTKRTIPRGTAYVEIKRHDLYLPEEKELYADFPNYDSSLASIKVPTLAYWSRMFLGGYDELYIVSPESSPNSSIADEDSRRTSPTSTWGQDSEDTRLGAVQEDNDKS